MFWASSLSLEEEEKVSSSSSNPSTPTALQHLYCPLFFFCSLSPFCMSSTPFTHNTFLFHLLRLNFVMPGVDHHFPLLLPPALPSL